MMMIISTVLLGLLLCWALISLTSSESIFIVSISQNVFNLMDLYLLLARLMSSHTVYDWNLYLRMTNRNTKNTVTIAHWNEGSSFLSKSEHGKEKLQEIENFL